MLNGQIYCAHPHSTCASENRESRGVKNILCTNAYSCSDFKRATIKESMKTQSSLLTSQIFFCFLFFFDVWTCFHTRCLLSVYEFDLVDLRERHLADPFRPSRRPFGKVLLLHSGSRKYSGPVFPLCNTATSRCSSRPHSCFCFRPRAFDDLHQAFFFVQPGFVAFSIWFFQRS